MSDDRSMSERVAYLEGRVDRLSTLLREQEDKQRRLEDDYQQRLAKLHDQMLELAMRHAEHMVNVADILSRRRAGPPS